MGTSGELYAVKSAETVFRQAIVIDGTGAERFTADVAVVGDKIIAIGDLGGMPATVDVNAAGLVLCPGFIDVHTHDDRALLETPSMVPKVSQGVTTVVAGNCGISLAPLPLSDWPPAPMDLLGDQAFYRYDSLGAYVEQLKIRPPAVNAALLVGHTTLRHRHMAGGLDRAATDRELAAMEADVEHAMEEGAVGVSTGLDYAETVHAPSDEVVTLARAARRGGGLFACHTRDYFQDPEAAVEEAICIAREAEIPLVLSHHQVSGVANFGRSRRTLGRIAKAIESGDVGLDVYPYNA